MNQNDPEPLIAEGRWYGEIIEQPRGNDGFGYNPHFFDVEMGLSAAEMTLEQKVTRSHRGKAIAELMHKLARLPLKG